MLAGIPRPGPPPHRSGQAVADQGQGPAGDDEGATPGSGPREDRPSPPVAGTAQWRGNEFRENLPGLDRVKTCAEKSTSSRYRCINETYRLWHDNNEGSDDARQRGKP